MPHQTEHSAKLCDALVWIMKPYGNAYELPLPTAAAFPE